jgi:hypothetical protein
VTGFVQTFLKIASFAKRGLEGPDPIMSFAYSHFSNWLVEN